MADVRDQRVRLVVVTTVATAAGVGILSSLWLQHRRRVSTFGGFSGSAAGFSTETASSPDRADSTQPVNSRWDASSRRTGAIPPGPALAEAAPLAGGEHGHISSTAQPETRNEDSSAEHTWVAFESTGQLAAAATAAPPLGSDVNTVENGERSEGGGDVAAGSVSGQPQQVVLPPEDSAARAQARSNLASIYSTIGQALPPKQRPQKGVPQRSPSGTLALPEQPPLRANGPQPSSAPVEGLAERSSDAVAAANGPSSKAPGDAGSAQSSAAAVPLPGAVAEDSGAALPLWQRLLALTAAGIEADDERDDERDNNDTDAGPHEVSISSEWVAGSAATPERRPEQPPDAPPASEIPRPSVARLPPTCPRPREPTHVENGPDARPLVRCINTGKI